ncbi:TetR/AcrR family transcriptional regulator [Streptomyces sp. NBC_00053]|uniref:TetR/AcrR family transcriptional regulator n=1 Tax=unclassified Streptomyces TaxID=2593676 RepID=UPI000F5BD2A1|nr:MULTISPECIES: TetR/AcrR family transcriptional regulator [unclassified Streptomyces]WSG55514.1 TetR/AcrR family transcriptional regulator [Streptomyces sp. NBC_01732]WSX06653.1 TetR/AcrR family transcriptional regulator [Streptomyces sp. NBC_00987]MCX4391417.1 TetR/AcrR family transcriptional regulator [Streptomyces sp. NBC_01767]MCX5098131.1 TetR/AcrR family transcriptional regulator [Streptomyces sp. NBC_00439]MCX5165359.1 TetR/AcrR family transcriptional regulator [Streptomyces sp. NBC_0
MGRPVDQLTPKGAATRREILRAAARVFDAKGYALARMDDVVSETGLTKGAVYFHFKSKAALAHAVVDDQKQGMLAHVRRRLEGLGGPAAQVRGLVPVLVDLVIAEPAGWSVVRLDRELTTESPQEHAQVSVLAEWVGLVEELLLAGARAGDLHFSADAHALATVFVGAFDGLKGVLEATGRANPEELRRAAGVLAEVIEATIEAH